MADLTIGSLASAGGVGVETIRFYQRRGLLAEPAKTGGIRRYHDADVRRLRFIRSAQSAGFTLEEIRELLDLDAVDDRERARELARARITALDARMAELRRARTALVQLVRDCESNTSATCPILNAFEDANGVESDV